MPSINFPLFAFAACFIGNYGASSVMSPVTELRTNGAILAEAMPTQYEEVLGKDIQAGNHTFTVELEFLSDDPLTAKLARGLPIDATYINTAPAQSLYTLLLVSPDSGQPTSYFFPKLRTLKTRDLRYTKNTPTVTKITFVGEARNPNVTLFYQDTVANLVTTMGGISPV
jgi:hypothetical protein